MTSIHRNWRTRNCCRQVRRSSKGDVTIDQVLALFDADGKNVQVGQPTVAKATVVAQVVEHKKGDKIKVLKFKRKNRYQRVKWFRPEQTVLKIKSVKLDG